MFKNILFDSLKVCTINLCMYHSTYVEQYYALSCARHWLYMLYCVTCVVNNMKIHTSSGNTVCFNREVVITKVQVSSNICLTGTQVKYKI